MAQPTGQAFPPATASQGESIARRNTHGLCVECRGDSPRGGWALRRGLLSCPPAPRTCRAAARWISPRDQCTDLPCPDGRHPKRLKRLCKRHGQGARGKGQGARGKGQGARGKRQEARGKREDGPATPSGAACRPPAACGWRRSGRGGSGPACAAACRRRPSPTPPVPPHGSPAPHRPREASRSCSRRWRSARTASPEGRGRRTCTMPATVSRAPRRVLMMLRRSAFETDGTAVWVLVLPVPRPIGPGGTPRAGDVELIAEGQAAVPPALRRQPVVEAQVQLLRVPLHRPVAPGCGVPGKLSNRCGRPKHTAEIAVGGSGSTVTTQRKSGKRCDAAHLEGRRTVGFS